MDGDGWCLPWSKGVFFTPSAQMIISSGKEASYAVICHIILFCDYVKICLLIHVYIKDCEENNTAVTNVEILDLLTKFSCVLHIYYNEHIIFIVIHFLT
jgi:hypothetical protein